MRLFKTPLLILLLTTLMIVAFISDGAAQTAGTDQNMTFAPNVGAGADLFSAQGTASIPIDVPPARHGIQPAVSLQYSSSSANGWVG